MFRNYLVVQAKGTFFTTPYSSEPANTVLKVCSSLAKSTKDFIHYFAITHYINALSDFLSAFVVTKII